MGIRHGTGQPETGYVEAKDQVVLISVKLDFGSRYWSSTFSAGRSRKPIDVQAARMARVAARRPRRNQFILNLLSAFEDHDSAP
jgi:hypothetical protein